MLREFAERFAMAAKASFERTKVAGAVGRDTEVAARSTTLT